MKFNNFHKFNNAASRKRSRKRRSYFFFSVARHKSVQKRTKTWQLVATCCDLINQDCFLLLFLSLSLFPCVS
jgi:hypothetical protein